MSAISLTQWAASEQDKMRRGIVERITNVSIFARLLRFIPIPTFTYNYGEQTTLGSIAFRNLNEDYTADAGAVNPKSEVVKIFGGEIDTDRQLIGDGNNGPRASAIAAKVKRAGLIFDKTVIDGDDSVNVKEFRGLNKRLVNRQLITAGTNGAALALTLIDDLIDRVVGPHETKQLVMNKSCRRKMKALALGSAGGAALNDVGGSMMSYDGVKINIVDEDGDDETTILDYDETCGSSAVTTSMYCFQPGTDVEGEYLQGLIKGSMFEHEDQGARGTKRIDLVEAAMGIALFHGRAAARLKGILNQ